MVIAALAAGYRNLQHMRDNPGLYGVFTAASWQKLTKWKPTLHSNMQNPHPGDEL